MKDYLAQPCPEGLTEVSHFFIQDIGQPKTCYEMYIYQCVEDVVELPNGRNAQQGDLIHAQAHLQDNFNSVTWNIHRGPVPFAFWKWFNRVFIEQFKEYEIVQNPLL